MHSGRATAPLSRATACANAVLQQHMSNLTVQDPEGDEADALRDEANTLAAVHARLTGAAVADYRLFVLDCDGAVGWVLASLMVAYENEAGYDEPRDPPWDPAGRSCCDGQLAPAPGNVAWASVRECPLSQSRTSQTVSWR